jgi:hypothetical protein
MGAKVQLLFGETASDFESYLAIEEVGVLTGGESAILRSHVTTPTDRQPLGRLDGA